MPRPNYYLTKAEVAYLKDRLSVGLTFHRALLDNPAVETGVGVNIKKVLKTFNFEEKLYNKFAIKTRKKVKEENSG